MTLAQLTQSTHYDHSRMVSKISGLIAGYAGYSPTEAALVEQAALFHDVGKCDLDQKLLTKQGALTEQEFAIVKTHTQLGVNQIAAALQALSAAITVAGQHHERLDGSGYLGLSGDSIHPHARLVSVIDVYEALSSRRSYKMPWDTNAVCGYLKERAGKQFDADIVAILLAHIDEVTALYTKGECSHEAY